MLIPITKKEQALIVKNVVAACKDIRALDERGYKFLYMCHGLYSHYDISGFKYHYTHHNLWDDLLKNKDRNQYLSWSKSDKTYNYYMSRKTTFNTIMRELMDQTQYDNLDNPAYADDEEDLIETQIDKIEETLRQDDDEIVMAFIDYLAYVKAEEEIPLREADALWALVKQGLPYRSTADRNTDLNIVVNAATRWKAEQELNRYLYD